MAWLRNKRRSVGFSLSFDEVMVSPNWQKVLALDAKFNSLREPSIRHLYLRRRSQLLSETVGDGDGGESYGKTYLRLRSHLLTAAYGSPIDGRIKSRSNSVATFNTLDLSFQEGSESSRQWTPSNDSLTPSKEAHASRALVGPGSMSMSYSFTGVQHIFDQHSSCVNVVAFANNDPDLLCSADNQGLLCICNLTPPRVVHRLQAHGAPILSLEWSLSNDLLLTSSLDHSLSIWNSQKGILLRTVSDTSPVLSCAFQPANNNMFVMGNARGLVQVVSVSTGMVIKGGTCHLSGGAKASAICFSVSGSLLWVADDKGSIISLLFDISSGRLSKGRRFLVPEMASISCLSFRHWVNRQAQDPCLLVNSGGWLLLYGMVNPKDGTLVLKKRIKVCELKSTIALKSTFSPIMSFREGSCVVTGSESGCVLFYDIHCTSGSPLNTLQGHSAAVTGVSFSSDEGMLATADSNGIVIVWKKQAPS